MDAHPGEAALRQFEMIVEEGEGSVVLGRSAVRHLVEYTRNLQHDLGVQRSVLEKDIGHAHNQDRKIRFLEDQLHDIRALHHDLKKERDVAVEKITELSDQILELNGQLAIVQSEHDMLIERVRDGHLTELEFQALCHNLSPADLERFKKGCRDLWDKMEREMTQTLKIPLPPPQLPPGGCHDSSGDPVR